MEPLNTNEVSEKKEKAPAADRVSLGAAERARVEAWLAQVSEHTKGYLALSKSDVVNFILRHHDERLSAKELSKIRSDHYDPVRHITWIAPKIREALHAGDTERVKALQDELRKVELSATKAAAVHAEAPPRASERRKRKRKSDADHSEIDKEKTVRESEQSPAPDRP